MGHLQIAELILAGGIRKRKKRRATYTIYIQLFRQRLSKKSVKAYATMPKGSLENTQ